MHYRRLIIPFVVFALLSVASALDPVHVAVSEALQWGTKIIRRHEILGLGLFILFSVISSIVFFFSSAVIVPVASYAWGKITTILLLWFSWLLGACLTYWVGLHPGRRLAKWIMARRQVARYEKKLSARANFPLVLLFQMAVPSEVPGYVLGSLRYPFGRYLAVAALGELPFAVGAVYLGDSFVRGQYIPFVAIGLGGLLFSALAFYFLQRKMK